MTKKVRFLKSPSCSPYWLAYFPGDEAELEQALADDLIYQGIATAVEVPAGQKTEKAVSKTALSAEKR